MKKITFLIFLLNLLSCSISKEGSKTLSNNDLREKVQMIKDSISIGGMTIHNAFKFQILAHTKKDFDSTLILNKVYKPNRYVFDNCLGLIFGEENSDKFKPNGMYKWNQQLLKENDQLIREKISVLDSVDINALFEQHLKAIEDITGQKGEGTWLIYFGPKEFQIFGGCDRHAMILDMFGESWNSKSINILFAHELEHLVFEPKLENDPNGNTGLGITLDEGLAVYFTYVYLKEDIENIFYGEQTKLLFEREKEIFEKLEPFLFKGEDEGCPIYRHCERNKNCTPIVENIPENIQGQLCYFLGFRIIEKYVEKHGTESWKDIYEIPLKDFYLKSGYKEYIENL